MSKILLNLLLKRFRLSLPGLDSGERDITGQHWAVNTRFNRCDIVNGERGCRAQDQRSIYTGSDLMAWSIWILDKAMDSIFSITSLKLSYNLITVSMWGISVSC